MNLIGVLDSPYVRRVAISLTLMELPFIHTPLSVFRDFERFTSFNPVVKAPTLITDDGVMLMDSTLILDYLEQLAPEARRLMPTALSARATCLHMLGLSLAACDKVAQIAYETNLRPADRQYQPWLERISNQLRHALTGLDAAIASARSTGSGEWLLGDRLSQADIIAAITWGFADSMVPGAMAGLHLPALHSHAQKAEALDVFRAWPP